MKLTKKLAVALHRRLWNWIADETERQQRKVGKVEYPLFKHRIINAGCFCCEFVIVENHETCDYCPIMWKFGSCQFGGERSEYRKWLNAKTWQEAAHWARIIAQLPERNEETKE